MVLCGAGGGCWRTLMTCVIVNADFPEMFSSTAFKVCLHDPDKHNLHVDLSHTVLEVSK